ncbi:MAG: RES family NAD+ phosphorylase [Gemmatimonadetes bacterium]|nr:RES family NAD+ phosphorylase [Gemmatimonadota bacterium]
MRVYRLCRRPYAVLDGEGARLHGGRWNSPGRPVVYTSSSLSLSALEFLIHVDISLVPDDLVSLTIELPSAISVLEVDLGSLPSSWNSPMKVEECQRIGDAWLARGESAALRVPSVAVPSEWNILLNPSHPDHRRIRMLSSTPFHFDTRLLG